MVAWAQHLLDGLNRLPLWQVAVFFFACGAIQIAVPPFPGDILLFLGGGIWNGGRPGDLLAVLAAYWTGTTLASLAMHELGRRWGRSILSWRWMQKLFSPSAQERVRGWLNRHGAFTLFSAKFVTGVNVPLLLISGVMRLKRGACYPAVMLTTAVHNSLMFTLGSLLGSNWDAVKRFLSEYDLWIALTLALGIALAFWLRGRKAKKGDDS